MTPEQKFTTSILKAGETVKNWEDVAALSKVLNAASQAGSIQLEATLGEYFTKDSNQTIDLNAKLWSSGAKYALKLDAKAGEDAVSANAYFDPADRFVVTSQDLGGSYGIDMTNLSDALGMLIPSADGEMSGKNQVMDTYSEMIPAAITQLPEMLQKHAELNDKIVNVLIRSIAANASMSAESKTVTSMDRNIDAVCISIRIDNNAVAGILTAFYNELKNDPDFAGMLKEAMSAAMPSGMDGDPTGAMTFDVESDAEFNAMIEGLKASDPFAFTVVISTDMLGNVVRVDVNATIQSKTGKMNADGSVDPTVTEMPLAIALEFAQSENDFGGLRLTATIEAAEGVTVTMTLNVSVEKTEQSKTIRFNTTGLNTVFGGGDLSGSVSYNKSTGAARAYVEKTSPDATRPATSYEVNFIYKIGAGTLEFGRLEVKQNGEILPMIPDFMLTIKENDTMPAAPEQYTNILQMTDKQMEEFKGRMEETFAPFEDLFDFFGGENYGEKTEDDPWVDNPDGIVWGEITVAETEDQRQLLEAGFSVFACPESILDDVGEEVCAPKGALTSAIAASHDYTTVRIFYFKDAQQAKRSFAELNDEDYRLEDAKIVYEYTWTFEEDPDDNGNGVAENPYEEESKINYGDTDWEPALNDRKVLEAKGYTAVISTATAASLEEQCEVEEGSIPCMITAYNDESVIVVIYFTTEEQAKIAYNNQYEEDAEGWELVGAKIVYNDTHGLIGK